MPTLKTCMNKNSLLNVRKKRFFLFMYLLLFQYNLYKSFFILQDLMVILLLNINLMFEKKN